MVGFISFRTHRRLLLFVLHHLFLLFVIALFTSLLVFAVHVSGLGLPFVLGAAVFALGTKSNHANLMWLTDATHALSGIPVAICCLLASMRSGSPSRRLQALIFVLGLTGLLVREDIAALFPLVVLLGAAAPKYTRDQTPASQPQGEATRPVGRGCRACWGYAWPLLCAVATLNRSAATICSRGGDPVRCQWPDVARSHDVLPDGHCHTLGSSRGVDRFCRGASNRSAVSSTGS